MVFSRTISSGKAKRGFSLLELLLVIAVGTVIVMGALGAWRLVKSLNDTNLAKRQVVALRQSVKNVYENESTYPVATLLNTMAQMQAIPSEMGGVVAEQIRNPFGTVRVDGVANNHFVINFNERVPRASCIELGQIYTPAQYIDFVSLTVNGTVVTTFTIPGLTTACSSADNNTMIWEFL